MEHWRGLEDSNHLNKIMQLNLDILEDDVTSQFQGVLHQIVKLQADLEWQSLLQNRSPSELTPEERRRLQELQSAKSIQSPEK